MATTEPAFTITLLNAVRLASAAHDGQRRKPDDDPYILHPLRVAERVAGIAVDDPQEHHQMILAAVLHDVLEDTDVPADQIERAFGAEVLAIVRDLTQDTTLPKPERRRRMIEHCGAMSRAAQIVKLADRLDNMSEMAAMPAEFIARYCREAREMLVQMHGACPPLEAQIAELIERFDAGPPAG